MSDYEHSPHSEARLLARALATVWAVTTLGALVAIITGAVTWDEVDRPVTMVNAAFGVVVIHFFRDKDKT